MTGAYGELAGGAGTGARLPRPSLFGKAHSGISKARLDPRKNEVYWEGGRYLWAGAALTIMLLEISLESQA